MCGAGSELEVDCRRIVVWRKGWKRGWRKRRREKREDVKVEELESMGRGGGSPETCRVE